MVGGNGGMEKLGVVLTQASEGLCGGTFGLEGGEREGARMVGEH